MPLTRKTARYRDEDEENLAKIGDQEQKVHSMCECQRRQAHRKSHRESQLHGGKTYTEENSRINKVEMQDITRKYKVVNHVD